jgi:hypothetical protein
VEAAEALVKLKGEEAGGMKFRTTWWQHRMGS